MKDLPLVDLSLDVVGGVPASLLRAMAAERRLDLAGLFTAEGGYRLDAPGGWWKVWETAAAIPAAPRDWVRIVGALVEEQVANGVVYCEIRVSPQFCGGFDPGAWRETLHAMREAAEGQGVDLRLTATAFAHRGPEAARRAALCAAETAGDFVTGFALSGETARPKDHAWAFDCAREAGLGLVAEAHGPAAVRDVRRDLRPDRVSGGSGLLSDLALVDELAEAGTLVAICPGEDIALGRVADWRRHPAGQLFDRGVRLAPCSGAPAFAGPGLAGISARLHDAFDWDEGVFHTLAQTALDAAFCDADTRARIHKRLT
ncbi:MAG: adenosine deaminase [Paracoccaceae bacterium]